MYQEGVLFIFLEVRMALTLEATLVIPLTMAFTIGMISASIRLYDNVEKDSSMESFSFHYALDSKDIWSCRTNEKESTWSKMIAVNPIREKNYLSLAADVIDEIKDFIPIFREMEEKAFEREE